MSGISKLIVVGAGPCGLLLSLLLAQHGIKVDILEAGVGIDQRPRGLAYGPAGVSALRRAGVLDEIRQQTSDVREFSWRKSNGEILAAMKNMDDPENMDRIVLLPVHQLANLLMQHLEKYPGITVNFQHTVTAVGQHGEKSWVDVKAGDEIKRFEGDFVVGCDGANSVVRKSLYDHEFPGHTWDQRLVVVNMRYDFDQYNLSDCQWFIDPKKYGLHMLCRLRPGGWWRVVYSDDPSLGEEELRARLPTQFESILPGHPKPEEYEITRFSPYTMHQRCVKNMRVGRVLLAGDAAHLCNPMGGYGLTGGLADIGSLVDCLYGINDGRTSTAILDKWDEVRRAVYHNIVSPISTRNLERLWKDPEGLVEVDPMLLAVKQAEHDPSVAESIRKRELEIAHDMTQYFDGVSA